MRMTMGRRAYPSDLTDEQWAILGPNIPQPSLEGRPPMVGASRGRQRDLVRLA